MGIAVGMASSIPPHNLKDIYNALDYIIEEAMNGADPDEDKIIKLVQAPDFPTGGTIVGTADIIKGYKTGKGKVVIRSKYEIEESKGKTSIVISEIPYKVNKAKLVEAIDGLTRIKKDAKGKVEKPAIIDTIKEVRDESDKDGLRIVVELKKDANPQMVVNTILKHTDMQSSFSINMIALVNGQPEQITLKTMLMKFLEHAAMVIIRRTQFDLDKATKRLNIVDGMLKLANDEELLETAIHTIRHSEDPVAAIVTLGFNQEQAEHIVETKIRSLSLTSVKKFTEEKDILETNISKLTAILNDDSILLQTMKAEFIELKERFGDERKTEYTADYETIEDEDLIKDEMLIVSISSDGLIKSVEETEYNVQKRGGKGVKVANNKEDEIVKYMLTVNSKDDIMFFTNFGKCHTIKAYKIQKSARTARGKSINNYLSLDGGEFIVNVLTANLKDKSHDLLLVTRNGMIKRLSLEQLSTKYSYTKVITFKEGDSLVSALIVKEEDNVLISTAQGQAIRIAMNAEGNKQIRPMGRAAAGVTGIGLNDGDYVADMTIIDDSMTIFTISQYGLGKKTVASEWTAQGRGGKGIIGYKVTKKTGLVVCSTSVTDDDELFVATEQGQIVRIKVKDISTFGRSTSGVKIMNLNEGDKIASISKGCSETSDGSEEESGEA